MSILTDRQIKVRCQWQGKKITMRRDRGDHKTGDFTIFVDPREAERLYSEALATYANSELMPFELSDVPTEPTGFSPMIAPFHSEQIRTIMRDPNENENDIVFHRGLSSEQQHTRLRKLSSSILGIRSKVVGGDVELQIHQKVISSGLSAMGYDVTLARDFKIFTNVNTEIIDPLNMSERIYHQALDQDFCIIPPNSYILGHTEEWFDIPKNILALCLGKSTYARCGAIVNATPIEPGFKGRVVIEISNATNLPLKVYAGQGVAQFLFLKSDEDCEVGYGDRDGGKGGKYQGQTGLQTALV